MESRLLEEDSKFMLTASLFAFTLPSVGTRLIGLQTLFRRHLLFKLEAIWSPPGVCLEPRGVDYRHRPDMHPFPICPFSCFLLHRYQRCPFVCGSMQTPLYRCLFLCARTPDYYHLHPLSREKRLSFLHFFQEV